jgi:hypothetical protein
VVDRNNKAVIGQWKTCEAMANFPMVLDESDHRLFAVCRQPAVLVVLNTDSGAVITKVPTVGDRDDVFYDAARKQIYASGGEGAIAVVEQQDADHYHEIARVPTVKAQAPVCLCRNSNASSWRFAGKVPRIRRFESMQSQNESIKQIATRVVIPHEAHSF